MRWRVGKTSAMTSKSALGNGASDRRKATCSTERSSLTLIFSPLNIRAVASASPTSLVSSTSRGSVAESMRCFEKS
jgi:hypothetical protein